MDCFTEKDSRVEIEQYLESFLKEELFLSSLSIWKFKPYFKDFSISILDQKDHDWPALNSMPKAKKHLDIFEESLGGPFQVDSPFQLALDADHGDGCTIGYGTSIMCVVYYVELSLWWHII